MRRALLVSMVTVLAAGCGEDFVPETVVSGLRVLGMQASPPELRPGETALLKMLAVDPSRPGQGTTVLWLGCDPDPFNLNRTACADTTLLGDGQAFSSEPGTLPPGVRTIGLNAAAAYAAPAGLFDVLAPDDRRRLIGTVGQVLAFVVAEEVSPAATQAELEALFARVRAKEVASLLALFRVTISETTAPNRNPVETKLLVDGEAWPAGAALLVKPAQAVTLEVDVSDADFEAYQQYDGDGVLQDKTERVLAAWYATGGRFTEEATTVRGPVKTVFTAPGALKNDPVPEKRTGTLYTVLRDTRGGQSFTQRRLWVCNEALSAPAITSVTAPAMPGEPVTLSGQHLDNIVDVLVDGVALERGSYSAALGTWQGSLPAGTTGGEKRVDVHAKSCLRQALPMTVTLP